MKVSLITACRNSAATIRPAIESVLGQKGVDLEYIIVDGASTDDSVSVFREYEPRFNGRMRWVSEPDRGMYDALNKGLVLAAGDIVGILNADDVLAGDETLAHIVAAFAPETEALYADIRFVRTGDSVESLRSARTVRYCSAARWKPWMFRFAAMVPHPSFYVRRACFERLGPYSLDYRICADFELELRYLGLAKLRAAYLPECVVVMRMGGASTAGWRANAEINREDLRALRAHGLWSCLPVVYLKYLFKIWGVVFRSRRVREGVSTSTHSL